MSVNGAKLPLNKGPPRKATIEDMSDAVSAPTIITPHALPMFRDSEVGRSTKRKREKERMDPRKSRRPELPVTGPGRGGRVGASATQHVVQNLVRDTTRDEDVRATAAPFVLFWLVRWRAISDIASLPSALISEVHIHLSDTALARAALSPLYGCRMVSLSCSLSRILGEAMSLGREVGLIETWKGPIRAVWRLPL